MSAGAAETSGFAPEAARGGGSRTAWARRGHARRSFTVMSDAECLALLPSCAIGRVCFTDRAGVAVRPVTYVVHGSTIFFRTAAGSKLLSAARHAQAVFEVDRYDAETGTGWSVIATGTVRPVHDPRLTARVDAELSPWMPGELLHLVGMTVGGLSGRRISESEPHPY